MVNSGNIHPWLILLAGEPVRNSRDGARGGVQGGRGHKEGQPPPQGPGQGGTRCQLYCVQFS